MNMFERLGCGLVMLFIAVVALFFVILILF